MVILRSICTYMDDNFEDTTKMYANTNKVNTLN